MRKLLAAAHELQEFMIAQEWRFCFIGGIAYQRWGRPRVTEDADVTLITGFGNEESFVNALLGRYQPRRADARQLALRGRVLLIQTNEGIPFDIALGAFPFEEQVVQRASSYDFGAGVVLRTCSAEDLVTLKAFADRPQDWADVEMVVRRQGQSLDRRAILADLGPLCELKESPEIVDRLRELYERFPAE